MGLFSSKKTYVSSSMYSLYGDEDKIKDRPKYLQQLVVGSVLSGSKKSLGDVIRDGMQAGPAASLKNFMRWARVNYTEAGLPAEAVGSSGSYNMGTILASLPLPEDETAQVRTVSVGEAEYIWWAQQHVFANRPEKISDDWIADINQEGVITIAYTDGSSDTVTPTNFSRGSEYLYVLYILEEALEMRVFIYRKGDGNTELDAVLAKGPQQTKNYFPVIPVRLDNKWLPEDSEILAQARKAYKRGVGGKFDELVEKINENENLDEIDYAHVVFGIPLNTEDNLGREYVYRFFKRKLDEQAYDVDAYNAWKAQQEAALVTFADWLRWRIAEEPPPEEPVPEEPGVANPPLAPLNMVEIKPDGPFPIDFNTKISWKAISEETGTGLKKPDAKPGDLWFELKDGHVYSWNTDNDTNVFGMKVADFEDEDSHTVFYWQETADSWRALNLYNLEHHNFVYQGKSVETTAPEAFADEELSGFLIPLHYPTLNEMGPKKLNQLVMITPHVMFNSYKVVKKKWYQTGFFKILSFIIIVAAIYFTGGFAAMGSGGILGGSASVGAALGFSGSLAVVVGGVLNYVAALVLTELIRMGATALLGDKIGAIVAVIASVVAINGLSNMGAGKGFTIDFGSLSRVDTIIHLTSAVGNAVTAGMKAELADTLADTQKLIEDYKSEAERISKLYAENVGYANNIIDPLSFTDVFQPLLEAPAIFLGRTLMTGSDIADLSLGMLSNFTEISLSTDLPLE